VRLQPLTWRPLMSARDHLAPGQTAIRTALVVKA
jgi:hypothetical protein